jgi:hypothetical protein
VGDIGCRVRATFDAYLSGHGLSSRRLAPAGAALPGQGRAPTRGISMSQGQGGLLSGLCVVLDGSRAILGGTRHRLGGAASSGYDVPGRFASNRTTLPSTPRAKLDSELSPPLVEQKSPVRREDDAVRPLEGVGSTS